MIKICKTVQQLRSAISDAKKTFAVNAECDRSEVSLGVVPTMGALHEGHLSLVKKSAEKCDITVITVFVNPLQFGKNEDLDKYPRQLLEDTKLAESAGADLVFAPTEDTFYNQDHQTLIYNDEVSKLYCGAYRPGHFQGVLTVVAKLFLAVEADWAFFGKKDYQQAYIIKKMVSDLNWNIRIHLVATAREKSGLARSSRNEYLSSGDRTAAAVIYQSLKEAKRRKADGEISAARLRTKISKNISKAGGEVQYVEIASRSTLLPVKKLTGKEVVLVAAFFGATRLIDNLEI